MPSLYSDQCEPMCWETYVGQQLYKLTLLDLVVMIAFTFLVNLPRKCIGHKVLRGGRIGSAIGDIEFVIPKHVLDIVYGQTLCWLGMFYSPLLPAVTCIKLGTFLIILSYLIFLSLSLFLCLLEVQCQIILIQLLKYDF